MIERRLRRRLLPKLVGARDGVQSNIAGRPKMMARLDRFRDMLEVLGGGLGVTDPVSGKAVLEMWRPFSIASFEPSTPSLLHAETRVRSSNRDQEDSSTGPS
jgi:hypothetical protein